jgi:AcrR family transcriptional regulator
MASTKRDELIQLTDRLIREKGYNAFSFHDLAKAVGIKTASIHYHFPSKVDLGVAVIHWHEQQLERLIERVSNRPAAQQLEHFLAIYRPIYQQQQVCLVGSLAPDFFTLEPAMQAALRHFSERMLAWVMAFLEKGKAQGQFAFNETVRSRALLLVGGMVSALQLSRLGWPSDFDTLQQTLQQQLSTP